MNSKQSPKSVLIVDDDFVVGEGYRQVLEITGEFTVLAIIKASGLAVDMAKKYKPDLVIMDLKFGQDEHAGARAIRALRKSLPQTRILTVSVYPHLIQEAIAAGAHASVVRGSSLDTVLEAMHAALADDPIDPDVYGVVGEEIRLTKSEKETLPLIIRGLTNRQIAAQLMVGEETIKSRVSALLQKLNVGNRTELASRAFQLGLITEADLKQSHSDNSPNNAK